jgi:hypothetical protein
MVSPISQEPYCRLVEKEGSVPQCSQNAGALRAPSTCTLVLSPALPSSFLIKLLFLPDGDVLLQDENCLSPFIFAPLMVAE